ncbi:MAG TPA: iron chelate uptake ABC transporter family permease subunit, partial [Pyrinomonadaceae bacterium]
MKSVTTSGETQLVRGARSTLRRTLFVCLVLLAALVVAIIVSAAVGSERLPLASSLCALVTLGRPSCGLTPEQSAILMDIRLPRILLGASVGASLAAAGAGYQALLRNPLAEPYLLGISNGAAVGT